MKDPIDPKTMTNGETYWIHIKPSQETKGYTGPAVYNGLNGLNGLNYHEFKLPIFHRETSSGNMIYLKDNEFEVYEIE